MDASLALNSTAAPAFKPRQDTSVANEREKTAETAGTQIAAVPTDKDPIDPFIYALSEAAGHSPFLQGGNGAVSLRQAVKAAFAKGNGYLSRSDFEKIMKDYYGFSEVTREFWATFTGGDKSSGPSYYLFWHDGAPVSQAKLQSCLESFSRFKDMTESLRELCTCSRIYVVDVGSLKATLEAMGPQKIAAFNNPEVKKLWARAKQATGVESDDKATDKTWRWFSLAISLTYSQKIIDMYDKSIWGFHYDLKKLDNNNGPVKDRYNNYMIRWMNDSSGMTEKEWDGLERAQDDLRAIGKMYYYGNEKALTDVRLPDKKAEDLLDKAITLYKADPGGNRNAILDIVAQLREPGLANRAVPAFALNGS